jgi:arylformamidase
MKNSSYRNIFVFLAFCVFVSLAHAESPKEATPAKDYTLPPGAKEMAFGPHNYQRLDIYPLPGLHKAPMLLYVHGGVWTLFDKTDINELPDFAKRNGLLLASTNYRLGSGAGKAAEDVAGAVDWMLQNGPSYGGDPKQLYLLGWSSGGNSVSLVTVDPSYLKPYNRTNADIAGVIGLDGAGYNAASQIHSLFVMLHGPVFVAMWVAAFGAHAAELSPTLLVHKDAHYPPFLLIYTNHPGGRYYSEEFARKLKETGDMAAVVEARGRTHEGVISYLDRKGDISGQRIANFIATGKP